MSANADICTPKTTVGEATGVRAAYTVPAAPTRSAFPAASPTCSELPLRPISSSDDNCMSANDVEAVWRPIPTPAVACAWSAACPWAAAKANPQNN